MGNGLDTLAYSPSDLDKQIENMDDNIEWLSYSEFKETRKILNILKNMTIDNKDNRLPTEEYKEWSNYLLTSLNKSFLNYEINPDFNNSFNNETNNSSNNSKNIIEKNLEKKLKQEVLYTNNIGDTSLNNGLTWINNDNKPRKRVNNNNYE